MILDEKRIREIIRESLVSNEMSNLLNEKIGTSLKLGQATAIKVADSAVTSGGSAGSSAAMINLQDARTLRASNLVNQIWKSGNFECSAGIRLAGRS